jgi:hypothetical protein
MYRVANTPLHVQNQAAAAAPYLWYLLSKEWSAGAGIFLVNQTELCDMVKRSGTITLIRTESDTVFLQIMGGSASASTRGGSATLILPRAPCRTRGTHHCDQPRRHHHSSGPSPPHGSKCPCAGASAPDLLASQDALGTPGTAAHTSGRARKIAALALPHTPHAIARPLGVWISSFDEHPRT